MNQVNWSGGEVEAWKLPEKITVSEWASRYRILDAKNCAEPGQWKNERTPYLSEIMDAFVDPEFEEITLMGSTQIGKTEGIFNMMAYAVDQDPGPMLYVKAREDDAFSDAHNRLRAMFTETNQLGKHIPSGKAEDLMMKEFRLDRMTMYFAGSNSPAALSGKPIRYLFLDETDKYPRFSGREASPIKLARERTRTFWNRKIFKSSSPTVETGYINREYKKSDQRKYYVPCPHCGHYQIFVFQQIVVPDDERDPGRIRELKLAWYECENCRGKIRDHQKPKMLHRGVWLSRGQKVGPGGQILGDRPHSVHAGFWINAIYSPWLSFSEIMAEFLDSKDSDEDLMNFANSWLAEVWKEKAEYRDSTQIIKNRAAYPARVVPAGVSLLVAGVDVQKHVFYYVIRAWGPRLRSWLVDEGQLEGEDMAILDDEILNISFPVYQAEDGRRAGVALCCIDSGYRTDEVYEFCRVRPRTRAVKGASRNPQRPFWSTMVDVHPVTGEKLRHGGIRLWLLDTDFFKDFIYRRMGLEPENKQGWHVHQDISLEYAEQISSERKVTVRKGRHEWEEWQLKSGGAKNHLWDAEVYTCAAAHMLKVQIEGAAVNAPGEQARKLTVRAKFPSVRSHWL